MDMIQLGEYTFNSPKDQPTQLKINTNNYRNGSAPHKLADYTSFFLVVGGGVALFGFVHYLAAGRLIT